MFQCPILQFYDLYIFIPQLSGEPHDFHSIRNVSICYQMKGASGMTSLDDIHSPVYFQRRGAYDSSLTRAVIFLEHVTIKSLTSVHPGLWY